MSNRVPIDLNETATLLRKGAQEATRGLLPFITGVYDCPPSARLPNRKEDLRAENPFLCIYGSTTAEWLRNSLTMDDIRGGLAGRFMYIVGKEKAPIPFPPLPSDGALEQAERVLVDARNRLGSTRRYGLSPEAMRFWESWYVEERSRDYGKPILDCLAQRLHVFAWKIALVYAALEDTAQITRDQLRAACAFADYQRQAQAHVLGDMGDSQLSRVCERIRAALTRHGPLASWELSQRVRHVEPDILVRARETLRNLGEIELRGVGRAKKWHLIKELER